MLSYYTSVFETTREMNGATTNQKIAQNLCTGRKKKGDGILDISDYVRPSRVALMPAEPTAASVAQHRRRLVSEARQNHDTLTTPDDS